MAPLGHSSIIISRFFKLQIRQGTVESSVSTPKVVQKKGDTNVRLVKSVLGEVKLNSFGVDSLETVKYVERLDKQNVSSTFSSYNLFNYLQI